MSISHTRRYNRRKRRSLSRSSSRSPSSHHRRHRRRHDNYARNGSIRINVSGGGGGENNRPHHSFLPNEDRRLLDFLICLLNGIQPNISNCVCSGEHPSGNVSGGNITGNVLMGNTVGGTGGTVVTVNGNSNSANDYVICGNMYSNLYEKIYRDLYSELYSNLYTNVANICGNICYNICANFEDTTHDIDELNTYIQGNLRYPVETYISGIISPSNGMQPTTQYGNGYVATHSTGLGVDQWTFVFGNGNVAPTSFVVCPINGSSTATASIDPACIIHANIVANTAASFYLPMIVNSKPTADGFSFIATFV